jgi:hypothetical protein
MKFKAFASALAALSISTSAFAQQAAEHQVSPERIKAHVAFLSNDLLEGREAGTRGHELAALYVAQQLAGLGFEGAGPSGSFFQPVTLQTRKLDSGTVILRGPGGSKTFEHGDDVVMGASVFEASQTISAPVVFAGFGLTAPGQKHDDYAGLDVKGKIVAIFSGTPKGWPSDVAAHLNGQKSKMAQAAGAVGIVTMRRPTDEKILPWARIKDYLRKPAMTFVGADGKPHVEAPFIKTGAYFNDPAAEALFVGARRSFREVQAEAEAGKAPKGFALPMTAAITRASTHSTVKSPNVVGILPGSDPVLKNEVVVLMGHLDHLGTDEGVKGADKIYNGAMDNASGVAILLEVAHALAEGRRPKRSIMVFTPTAEEKGLLGAEYFGASPPIPAERIVAAVNMDMPILTYDFGEAVGFGAEHTTLGAVASAAAAAEGVKLVPDPQPEQRSFTRSDHYALVKAGIPAIYLDTAGGDRAGGKSGEAASSEFLEKHYHEPSDDISLPFDWGAAARLARINVAIARQVADAPERPRWLQGSFFGETFAAGQPKAPRASR